MGELELQKGDILEILSVGEQGFWEGKNTSGNEGWFPSECIEEIHDLTGTFFICLFLFRNLLIEQKISR